MVLRNFEHYPVLIQQNDSYFLIEEEVSQLSLQDLRQMARTDFCPLLCNHKIFGFSDFSHLDILHWVSFDNPTLIAAPTIFGLAKAFQQPYHRSPMQQAKILRDIATQIQQNLHAHQDYPRIHALAQKMRQAGWGWFDFLTPPDNPMDIASAFMVWQDLPEWQNQPILPPKSQTPPNIDDISAMLEKIVDKRAQQMRDGQHAYSHAVNHIFNPRFEDTPPAAALLEAHTGTGKTLGYLLPAYLYTTQNNASVWVSTYSRNLQHQIYREALSFHDNVTIRKGRENYLCLLNYKQALDRYFTSKSPMLIALGLLARWLSETKFGDMNGDDFPAWLEDLFDNKLAREVADRRYGCIHQLCPHYKNCFIESVRHQSKHADIIISNHALSLTEAQSGAIEHNPRLNIMIFDEAHHLFQAADNFYAVSFNGAETTQLKQWLDDNPQHHGGRQSSLFRPAMRGLQARLGKFASHKEIAPLIHRLSDALVFLPQINWCQRIINDTPQGETEIFLHQLNLYVTHYNKNADPYYNLEAPITPTPPALNQAAHDLAKMIELLAILLGAIITKIENLLDDDKLDKVDSINLERIKQRLEHFSATLTQWQDMMRELAMQDFSELCIDWLMVKRRQGISYDFEFCRHAINPMQLLSDQLLQKLNGFAMTSATLFSHHDVAQDDLANAMQGISDFPQPLLARFDNDFDYANRTRIFIANDINKKPDHINDAYLQLFLASKGGSLGLFTSIKQLKNTHQAVNLALAQENIALYAQHVDKYSVPNLVEIFKNDENACLLGTDSLRDGIDVPGRGLRQVILDKMPWTRPDILTSARQQFFGKIYPERLVRFKLKQAFGRLMRHKNDKGVFVLLDHHFPSRMADIFPEHVTITRAPINEIISDIKEFLDDA
ncbi:MAG: ATP-dependent DNA helicase [Alphaproteobacteria bacterium]|nr:ATP-dependent DNA helicase [Alphaproteobacteria bacterium]